MFAVVFLRDFSSFRLPLYQILYTIFIYRIYKAHSIQIHINLCFAHWCMLLSNGPLYPMDHFSHGKFFLMLGLRSFLQILNLFSSFSCSEMFYWIVFSDGEGWRDYRTFFSVYRETYPVLYYPYRILILREFANCRLIQPVCALELARRMSVTKVRVLPYHLIRAVHMLHEEDEKRTLSLLPHTHKWQNPVEIL